MADNVGYTPGSGATVAADEIDGVLHQRVKIGVGADGSAVDVSDANPLPIKDDDARNTLRDILLALMSPRGYDMSSTRYRQTAIIESGTVTTVTTVTTCSTVTNLSTIDTLQGRIMVYGANMSAWSDCVRSRIT